MECIKTLHRCSGVSQFIILLPSAWWDSTFKEIADYGIIKLKKQQQLDKQRWENAI